MELDSLHGSLLFWLLLQSFSPVPFFTLPCDISSLETMRQWYQWQQLTKETLTTNPPMMTMMTTQPLQTPQLILQVTQIPTLPHLPARETHTKEHHKWRTIWKMKFNFLIQLSFYWKIFCLWFSLNFFFCFLVFNKNGFSLLGEDFTRNFYWFLLWIFINIE